MRSPKQSSAPIRALNFLPLVGSIGKARDHSDCLAAQAGPLSLVKDSRSRESMLTNLVMS